MPDVEMKPEDAKTTKDDKKPETETKPPPVSPVAEIKSNAALIERAVATSTSVVPFGESLAFSAEFHRT
jgi:26S proteasome regulatory subunit N3